MSLKRSLTVGAGYLFLGLGAALLITPIPIGGPVAAIGVLLVVPNNAHFRRFLLARRKEHGWLDQLLVRVSTLFPKSQRRVINLTRASKFQ